MAPMGEGPPRGGKETHLYKAYSKRKPVLQVTLSSLDEGVETDKDKEVSERQEWKVVRRGTNAASATSISQPDVPNKN